MLHFPLNKEQPELCVSTLIEIYREKTKNIRSEGTDSLILACKQPHRPVGSQTISRWIKEVLTESGIDTSIYSGYSAKHAAISAAKRKGTSIEVIRKAAGWSKRSNVFGKFYNRPLCEENNFATIVLKTKK